jgi:acyl-CoA synthetase (AMP-forming)/AMP-acid ligase II
MVSHTYSYMAAMAHGMSYSRGLPIECDLISCSFLPVLFHIGDHAHVLPSMLSGGRAVVGRTLDPALTAATVQREGVTALWGGSPQFLHDLMRALDADPYGYDMRTVSVIIYGWSAMPPALIARFQERCDGVHFVGIFGQTEAIACHRFWPAKWPELHRRTAPEVNYVGVPSPLLGSSVVDEEMGDLRDRPGVPGEAVYRSPAISSGYFRDRPATEAAFRGGWFHSGDMCTYDADGLRTMIDRYKGRGEVRR